MLKGLWTSGRERLQVIDPARISLGGLFQGNARRSMMEPVVAPPRLPGPGRARRTASQLAREPSMSQRSERLVVFVTPAQKRVLAARAARMGISVSELVRRAVLAFDDTGQEVRAAGLVDRLGAASEANRNDILRRLAQGRPGELLATTSSPGARAPLPGQPGSDAPVSDAQDEGRAALPLGAAVARALIAQEQAQACALSDPCADAETEALVARAIRSQSEGSV